MGPTRGAIAALPSDPVPELKFNSDERFQASCKTNKLSYVYGYDQFYGASSDKTSYGSYVTPGRVTKHHIYHMSLI